MRVAAVDVGTNSVRLLVAEPDGGGAARGSDPRRLRVLARPMTITRLGAGVDDRGLLDDEALQRTLDVIEAYAATWRRLGATRVRIAATSAIRDAADRDRFFEGVRERAGTDAEVLTGAEEAATAFRGAVAGVDVARPVCVLDIGGGSTELIVGDRSPDASTSRQLGCVRLTERCLRSDPPTAAELALADAAIGAELDAAERAVDPARARALVGVAGTVTTLAALHLGLGSYDPERIHATRVPVGAVHDLAMRLVRMPSAARARLGPMAPGREDVIAAGALILDAVCRRFGFGEVVTSEADMLDGLALQLLDG